MRPTVAEERLIEFTLDTYGVQLGEILLAGLGEKTVARACEFELLTLSQSGAERRHTLRVTSIDDEALPRRLPMGREPLILLALLYMRELHGCGGVLDYTPQEVLELLGWKYERESRQLLAEGVQCYFGLDYRLAGEWWEEDSGEARYLEKRAGFFDCYGLTVAPRAGGESISLSFNEQFMDILTARLLFWVSADSIHTIRRTYLQEK